ncbi:MAG: hypothetical protein JWM78_640 [Verrucomicrobiaceae bacterium]|nr:hypothetical protein [Verrucomicrobiaceae bacterium]
MYAFEKKYLQKIILAATAVVPTFALAAPPSTSAYGTDAQHSYVEDATSKGIGQVNMITCIVGALAPDKLVNQGAYLALVDESKCDPNSRSSSSNSGSTDAAQTASFMTATVNSTRASNTTPMMTKAWLDESDEDKQTTIFVHIAASQAPTTGNQYGIFRLDYCGKEAGDSGACKMNGLLDAGANGLSYFENEEGDHGVSTKALRLNASSNDSGTGALSLNEDGSPVTFNFAYNHDYFLRGDQCFSRDASDADTQFSVWRYGLYDATSGDRVTVNSGFSIEYTPNASTTVYNGYLGYYGLQLPADATAALNAEANPVVKKVDYSNAGQEPTRTAYNVVRTPGKLTKYSKQTRTLKQIDKIKLNVSVGNNAAGFFAGANDFAQYELYWDDAAGVFKVDGKMNCSNNGCQLETFVTEQPAALAFFAAQGGVQGWSNSLGGEIFIDLHGISAIDSSTSSSVAVVYRSQDLVYPEDMPAALYCVRDCPTAASISAYFGQGQQGQLQSPSLLSNNWNPLPSGEQIAYTTSAGVLKDAANSSVVFTDQSALNNFPQYQGGIRSGRLFTAADLSAVACDDQPGKLCDYKVSSLAVYYVWETGANSFNQFAGVKDSNNHFLHFEAPLQLNYSVPSDSAKYGEYAGKSIVLQYAGFGELGGIPGYCVSHTTNQPVDCYSQNGSDDIRYVPAFIIPAASNQVSDGTHTYLVKWLEREIRFARKDTTANPSACAGLSTGNINVVLPTAADLKDPSSSAQTDVYLGVKPVLTGSPRVIQGEVKY